jgi:23S rRNA (cytidine1920-2'-O)/16S rRNA (cytidine1409-2'-O)-methyltransferase
MLMNFASRAGQKLDHALATFQIDVHDKICADLGCSTGGFVDCLLSRGAKQVFAVDTAYGVLDWKLRNDPRVVVLERTNAMHVELPMKIQVITIDVSWTKQKHILPAARRLLAEDGQIVTLIKPHYEAPPALLRHGVLPETELESVLKIAQSDAESCGFTWLNVTPSPLKGHGGNAEFLALLKPNTK